MKSKLNRARRAQIAALVSASSLFFLRAVWGADASAPRFEITVAPNFSNNAAADGRLFVVLARGSQPEPRLALGHTGPDAPMAVARDVQGLHGGQVFILDNNAFCFPSGRLSKLPAGDYFAQAVFDSNPDLRLANAPGNLYGPIRKVAIGADAGKSALELTLQVPPETLPPDTGQVKFLKIESKLLSDFHGRPIFLRAGIVLPRDYDHEPDRRYPLWVRIGGSNTRYDAVNGIMNHNRQFRDAWLADGTPRFILLQLDGAGPYGDPYQVNSANNGPYGDAITGELIPQVEQQFRAIGKPAARVLSGTSTGGWVSLALQVFYPDFFNGAWSSCPDPVDFRAFELVNLYSDTNAFMDPGRHERGSERDIRGETILTMRQEVGAEDLLGRGNSYTASGQAWGAWNAVFSPRGADGLPVPIWNPKTGAIDHAVAEQWKKYDLKLVLEHNWKDLAPKLRGKLHIASGESDDYFLNSAVHLLDEFLSTVNPPFEGSIVYGPGKGHGWSNLTLRQMLDEMKAATENHPGGA